MFKMPQFSEVKEQDTEKKNKKVRLITNLIYGGIFLVIIVLLIAFDQISKYYAQLYQPSSLDFLGSFLRLTFLLNKGAAWGFGGDNIVGRIILTIMSWLVGLGIIGYFIYVLIKKKTIKLGFWCIISVIFAGDVGNLIDRTFFFNRGVIDFLDITAWLPKFGIFNVADSCLVCGIIALIIYIIVEYVQEEHGNKKKQQEKLDKLNK